MRRLIPCGLVFLVIGCGNPKVGDVVTIVPGTRQDGTRIYFDESVYREAAGAGLTASQTAKAYSQERCAFLAPGSRLRVLATDLERGGLFVAVEHATTRDGSDFSRIRAAPVLVGRDGWVLMKDLAPK